MSDEFVTLLQNMRSEHERHHARLLVWREAGGSLVNYPDGETIDDFIEREARAIRNLSRAITRLEQRST